MTYRERVPLLADRLRQGLGPGPLVETCAPSGFVVSLPGVPLDPVYPAELPGHMPHASGAALLLTGVDPRPAMPRATADSCPGVGEPPPATGHLIDADVLASCRHPVNACVTSGPPKGVTDTSVTNLTVAVRERPGIGPGRTLVPVPTVSFDVAVVQPFVRLVGGWVVIADREVTTAAFLPVPLPESCGANVLRATWHMPRLCGWSPTPTLITMYGERLSPDRPWDTYGPTTATRRGGTPRPVTATTAYLLDEDGRLVPVELFIGGTDPARAYLRLPAERLVPAPFSGDLTRRHPYGTVEIGCHRIEPGRTALPDVRLAVAHPVPAAPDTLRPVLYAVAEEESSLLPTETRVALAARLSEHMAAYEPPLTSNREAPPASIRAADPTPRTAPSAPTTATGPTPRTPAERRVAAVLVEGRGHERAGAHDDFSWSGGRSAPGVRTASRPRAVSGVDVPARLSFEVAKVERVARFADDVSVPGIGAVAHVTPASSGQRRLWSLDRSRPWYLVPISLRLRGELDVDALVHALRGLTTRHEVLRTRYAAVGGELMQLVDPPQPVRLEREDLRGLSAGERERRLAVFVTRASSRPFRLGEEIPFRAHLAKLGEDDHALVVLIHRIACDDWSMDVIARELRELYRAEIAGGCPALERRPVQFADFAAWQRTWLDGDDAATQLAYWRERLDGLTPTELPCDRPRPARRDATDGSAVPNDRPQPAWRDTTNDSALPDDRPSPARPGTTAGSVGFSVPASLARAVLDLGRDERATPFMTMLAVFCLLLAGRTGRDDVAVGTTVAARTRPELENLVGCFVNSVVLRADLSGCSCFADLLAQTRDTTLGALANQDLPIERLAAELSVAPDPLFQVGFELEGSAGPSFALHGVEAEPIPLGRRPAELDLTLHLAERDDGSYVGDIEYATARFDRRTVEDMAGEFVELLVRVAASPQTPPRLLATATATATGTGTGRTGEPAGASGAPVIDQLVASEEYTAPRTAAEKIIAGIWADVLDVDRVGTRDDFFQLGGHFTLAARVHSRIQDELDIDLPLSALFDATTLTELAAEVERAVQEDVARLSDAEVDAMLSEEGT